MSLLFVFTIFVSLTFCSATTTAAYDAAKCDEQAKKIKSVTKEHFINEKVFTNETRTSVLLSWSPSDKESIILVTTGPSGGSSEIYMSKDAGATFDAITSKFNDGKINIVKAIGLQRNTFKPEHVIIVAEETDKHYLFISMNNGTDWEKYTPPFLFIEAIKFNEKMTLYGLATASDKTLYGTTDGGKTWTKVQENTEKYDWSSHKDDKPGSIYILRRTDRMGIFSKLLGIGVSKDLLKVDGFGSTPKEIYNNVWQFSAHGKFLFVSEQQTNDIMKRHMKVSIDGGNSFHEVQLPSITPDRFYAIMDMSEELIFMHVDNPGDTGHGTLYTSGSDGTIFSQSLDRHLYPNFLSITDFYRVLSMRGTYITTKMNADNSMHSVISFDRGAEWRSLTKPENMKCPDGIDKCSLQISSAYSKMNQVNQVQTHLPLSSKWAPGIILVHGHTHQSLQTSPPDVYVTSNGGYSWNKALDGPHLYQIADNGGLLVAVADNSQNVMKFSTDEGRCWHHYQFTDTDFQITGLLTEPNNQIMKVMVWGFGKSTHKWRVYNIDFSKVVTRACNEDDYESWVPHGDLVDKTGTRGCLLGKKEKFMRLKKDSWCSNGKSYNVQKSNEACLCTKDDYECEYGYSRPINSQICKKDDNIIALDACIKGDLKKIITKGYRLLPGDVCDQSGKAFKPDPTKQVALNKRCGDDQKGIDFSGVKRAYDQLNSKTAAAAPKRAMQPRGVEKSKIIWIVCGICLVLIVGVLLAVVVARYRQMREREVSLKFSLLTDAHDNDNDFGTSVDADLLDAGQQPIQKPLVNGYRANGVEGKTNPVLRSYHDDSDVDILE